MLCRPEAVREPCERVPLKKALEEGLWASGCREQCAKSRDFFGSGFVIVLRRRKPSFVLCLAIPYKSLMIWFAEV